VEIRYETTYRDREGEVVATREDAIREILQPGTSRSWRDLTDGMTPPGAVSASLRVVGGQVAVPAAGR
jgi:hypothetical protein